MVNKKNKIGIFGEGLARKYLIKNGYQILRSNVRFGYKEIDIIAQKEDRIIFVEVKTRTNDVFGSADSTITSKKIKNLKKAVFFYISRNNIDEKKVQIDFISVDINKGSKTAKIKHFKSIV